MKNILVLAAGRRVELIQALQQDLAARLPGQRVLATDMRPETSAACQVADQAITSPSVRDPGYIDWLLQRCLEHEVGLALPTIDTELLILARARERFAEHGIHLIISDEALIQQCRDKRLTAELFQSIDLATPEIYPRDAIRFPAFAKPYDGSRSIGALALPTASSLTQDLLADEKLMFMAFVDGGHDEYTIDAYYDRSGSLRSLVPRQRLEVRTGEVSKGITRRGGVYDYLWPRLARLKGARGCLTVQIFADLARNSFAGIEINPRFGGGFPLSHAAGATYGGWLMDEYLLSGEVATFDGWKDNLLMLRYDAKILVEDADV